MSFMSKWFCFTASGFLPVYIEYCSSFSLPNTS